MKIMINNIISVILTGIIYLLGGFDIALKSLFIIMIFDYITGVASAIYNKELSSKIGFWGIIKKIIYLLVVALSVVLDELLGQSGILRTVVIYFFVANDGISILENISEMGILVPNRIKECLEQIQNTSENKEEENDRRK